LDLRFGVILWCYGKIKQPSETQTLKRAIRRKMFLEATMADPKTSVTGSMGSLLRCLFATQAEHKKTSKTTRKPIVEDIRMGLGETREYKYMYTKIHIIRADDQSNRTSCFILSIQGGPKNLAPFFSVCINFIKY